MVSLNFRLHPFASPMSPTAVSPAAITNTIADASLAFGRLLVYVTISAICLGVPELVHAQPGWIQGAPIRDYCFPQIFNATCPPGYVVFIQGARYGRMKHGRCITSDYNVGCSSDVLIAVDQRCSGRQSCEIAVPDTELHELQPCPKDLFAYLEAGYNCVKVEGLIEYGVCSAGGRGSTLTKPRAYLSSLATSERGVGGADCPWIITVAKGQQINVTLFDFGVATRYKQSTSLCHVYARITERSVTSEVTVCGDGRREKNVYISDTESITIRLSTFKQEQEQDLEIYFLLYYEAVGCLDPWFPVGSVLTRQDKDKATIKCNFTSQSWSLTCHGSKWFGNVQNCSTAGGHGDPSFSTTNSTTEDSDFNYGLLVAILTGILLGVFIGVLLLTGVILCHKRMSHDHAKHRNLYSSAENTLISTDRNYVERPMSVDNASTMPSYSDYETTRQHKYMHRDGDMCCGGPAVHHPGCGAYSTYSDSRMMGTVRQSPIIMRGQSHTTSTSSPLSQHRDFASIRRPQRAHIDMKNGGSNPVGSGTGSGTGTGTMFVERSCSNMADVVPRCGIRPEAAAAIFHEGCGLGSNGNCGGDNKANADVETEKNKLRDRRDPYGFEMMERMPTSVT